jgi:hypothetical protein
LEENQMKENESPLQIAFAAVARQVKTFRAPSSDNDVITNGALVAVEVSFPLKAIIAFTVASISVPSCGLERTRHVINQLGEPIFVQHSSGTGNIIPRVERFTLSA